MSAAVYDAVVVGAGPAGGIAALRLAGSGARVLLLEKHGLGRDKPCGGGLTPRAWEGLEVSIDHLVVCKAGSSEVHHGREARVQVGLRGRPVWMVHRRALDAHIAVSAAQSGAYLHDREAAVSISEDAGGVTVRTTKGTYRAAAALLASGAEGSLRAACGMPPPTTVLAAALELDAPARTERLAPDRLVFDYSIPGGYAWAFPKGDCWNVGVLSQRRDIGRELRARLADHIGRWGLRFAGDAEPARHALGRRIPLNTGRSRLCTRRVALLGDAAGLADPLFGEGIAQAFASGRVAALVVQQLLTGASTDLSAYPSELHRVLGTHLRRMRWLARAVYARPFLAVRMLGLPPSRAIARRVSTESWGASSLSALNLSAP